MAGDFDLKELKKRMDGALASLKSEFGGLRTGRANAGILDGVMVSAYGSEVPLNTVGSVTVPESRMLMVNVWDKTQVQAVDKAIRQSNLGLNPIVDGQSLRIPMPPLTEERRRDLVKVANGYAESAKGNGRWAQARHRPRVFGHQAGVKTVRRIVEDAADIGVCLAIKRA